MLLFRSISLEVFLLLLVRQYSAQEDYGLDDSEDHSDFTEDGGEYHEHPDYSKYYSVDGSAPQVEAENTGNGFVGSSDLAGFFAPSTLEYEESIKQPRLSIPASTFVPQGQEAKPLPNHFAPIQTSPDFHFSEPLRDFFVESQKKRQDQQKKEDYIRPGPNYISHQIPLHGTALDEVKSASAEDVERIPPRPNKPKTSTGGARDEGFTDVEGEVENEARDDKYILGLLTNSKAPVDYNIGKSSSTVSQFPAAAGYVKPSPGKLSPYQKYSFQPPTGESALKSKYFGSPSNIDSSYNPNYEKLTQHSAAIQSQPTEEVPSHIKSQGCRKINRPSSSESEDLNCFVCENAATKSKYTQCSYSSENQPEAYSSGKSERYSAPAEEINLRYRRGAADSDPYYRIRERSRKASDEPTIPADYSAGFQYEPEYFDETNQQLSYSEKQSEELKKDPKNCKKVDKKGMTCTICTNPETGGNYEQCSYTSEPTEKKYSYVTEKKYDSDDPEESKVSPQKEEAESSEQASQKPEPEPTEEYEDRVVQKSPRKRNDEDRTYEDEKESDAYYYPYAASKLTESKDEDDEKYEVPTHFSENIKSEKRKGSLDDEPQQDFDEYHARLFPEQSEEESKRQYDRSDYPIPEATKQNVEEVLAEFSKKDRSTCKKSEKNGMTCYLCVDEDKIQQEECMYVQESRPQSSHVAYHQLQGKKKLEDDEAKPKESKEKPVVSPESKKKRFFRKAGSPTPFLVAAASEASETVVPYEKVTKHYKRKRSPKKYRSRKDESEPNFETPTEVKVHDEEGAYSEETKPVYSKLHGVKLPKYMVEKSIFEREFDSFSGSF